MLINQQDVDDLAGHNLRDATAWEGSRTHPALLQRLVGLLNKP